MTWVILKEVTGDRAARPAGWEQFAATLELIDGAWFVSDIEVRPEGI